MYGIPEGHKCIISAHSKKTIIRNKDGYIVKKCNTLLPNGHKTAKERGRTLVQGVYCENLNIIYLTDVIMWNDELMTDSVAEFRLFILFGKILDLPKISTMIVAEQNEVLFRFPNVYSCNKAGLENIYFGLHSSMDIDFTALASYAKTVAGVRLDFSSPAAAKRSAAQFAYDNTGSPYVKDGIAFVKKEGLLTFGYSSEYLQWKDQFTSRYFAALTKFPYITILRASSESVLQTQDGYKVSCTGVAGIAPGKLYEVSYEEIVQQSSKESQETTLKGLKILKEVKNKALGSTMSQMLFKLLARTNALMFEELVQKVAVQEKKEKMEE